jgi:hypothetical protein
LKTIDGLSIAKIARIDEVQNQPYQFCRSFLFVEAGLKFRRFLAILAILAIVLCLSVSVVNPQNAI